jgi:UDP-N-acetylglucosamine--N-acetylmuramyl-(pentapeptide) pyrophosphoryl-undecaprenol N-acetylglucosamine transferase
MNKIKNNRIIISGGGTGGHIFPAISIANALKAIEPGLDILFVGATGRMEMEKVPAAGYPIVGLPIMGFNRKFSLKNGLVIFKLMYSLVKARKLIKKINPAVAIGVGGYASGPVLRIAAKMGIPTLIQEQNSYAGVTNRLLAKKASKICVAYENMNRYFPAEKIILTGNPVRQDLENIGGKRAEAYNYFQLGPSRKTLLILGGSLGARTINESLTESFEMLANSNIQVIWQTGSRYFDDIITKVKSGNAPNIKVHSFISRMDLAYSAADLVISRAGACTISELCLVGKPVILVPSPNVAEDHQTKNAMALIEKDAARMVKDGEANKLLTETAMSIIHNEALLFSLSANISKMAKYNSAKKIAEEILQLMIKE